MGSKIIKLFLILFVAIVVIYTSSALTEDFYTYFQQSNVRACSCDVFSTEFVVKNTGSITSSYQILKTGSASGWTNIPEDSFALNPGETKTIPVYTNLPCGAEGTYTLGFNVTTLFGKSSYSELRINTGNCQNIELNVKENVKEACPCSPVSYEFVIRNSGSYAETYSFALSKYGEYATLSESSLTLLPGESKNIFAYLNLPCGIYGINNIDFIAKAKKSEFSAVLPLQLRINPCYDFDFSVSDVSLCSGERKQSSLIINNIANITNQYTISADSKLIEIENKSVTLLKKQSLSVPFFVNAGEVEPRTENITFELFATRGELKEEKSISVAVERCYSVELSSELLKDDLIAGKTNRYKINIINNGTKAGTYKLSLDGADWFRLTSYDVAVPSMSSREIELIANIPQNATTEKRWVMVIASILNSTKSASLNFEFNIHSLDDSYKIDILPIKTASRYGNDSVKIKLKNVGIESGNYEMVVDGPPWISVLDFDREFSLAPGEEKEVSLITSADESVSEDDYKTTFYAKIKGTDLAYTKEFEIKLRSAPWYAKMFFAIKGFLISYWLYVVIAVAALIVLLLIIYSIKALARKMRERREKKFEEVKHVEIVEEPLRLAVKRHYTKRSGFFKVLGLLLLILVVLGGLSYLGYNYVFKERAATPEPTEEFKPTVEVNRTTGLEGFENVVYIRGEGPVIVPVLIKNNAPTKVVYDIRINSSWIESDVDRLELNVNETKTINLKINPTPEISDGNYKIVLGLRIAEKDISYKESIELRIQKQRSLLRDYLPYISAGLIILVLLLTILKLTRRSGFETAPERAEIKLVKEKKERHWLKWFVLGIIIIAVLVGLVYFLYLNWPEANPELDINFLTLENQSGLIELSRGEQTIIPIMFRNAFEDSITYNIEFEEDWIDSTKKRIRLEPGESIDVNITALPNENVSDGVYEVKIIGEIREKDVKVEKIIALAIKTKGFALLKRYPYYVAAAIIVTLVVFLLVEYRSARKKRIELIESIKKEVETEKRSVRRKKIKLK